MRRSLTVTSTFYSADTGKTTGATLKKEGYRDAFAEVTLGHNETTDEVNAADHSVLLYNRTKRWEAMGSEEQFRLLDGIWIYVNGTCEIPPVFDAEGRHSEMRAMEPMDRFCAFEGART